MTHLSLLGNQQLFPKKESVGVGVEGGGEVGAGRGLRLEETGSL